MCDEPCTPRSLLKVIWETKPKPKYDPASAAASANANFKYEAIGHFLRQIDSDEVYPGIFVGDEASARNIDYLKKNGITHVINTAQGSRIAQVNTTQKFYDPHGIRFLGLKLMDTPETKISPHFDECSDFIDSALSSNGKVLVHCFMGISRSATIVLAYLMQRKGLSAEDAIRTVRQNRDVSPNNGFLQQLCELDNQLRNTRQASL